MCFIVGALALQLSKLYGNALVKLLRYILMKKHKQAHIEYMLDLILIANITYYAAVDRAA